MGGAVRPSAGWPGWRAGVGVLLAQPLDPPRGGDPVRARPDRQRHHHVRAVTAPAPAAPGPAAPTTASSPTTHNPGVENSPSPSRPITQSLQARVTAVRRTRRLLADYQLGHTDQVDLCADVVRICLMPMCTHQAAAVRSSPLTTTTVKISYTSSRDVTLDRKQFPAPHGRCCRCGCRHDHDLSGTDPGPLCSRSYCWCWRPVYSVTRARAGERAEMIRVLKSENQQVSELAKIQILRLRHVMIAADFRISAISDNGSRELLIAQPAL